MTTARGTVLVVDDDADIREALVMLLEAEGYATLEAKDGVDALALLIHRPLPAVILLDVMMPRMNGADVLRALKSDAALAGIPVVVLSGDTDAVASATRLGASESIPKPPHTNQILETVGRYVQLQ